MDKLQVFLVAFATAQVVAAPIAEVEMMLAACTAQPGHRVTAPQYSSPKSFLSVTGSSIELCKFAA
jgi:hypothetical protein